MGSKGTTTQTGAQTYTANPAVAQAGQQAIQMAQQATSQPFSLPVQQYAGFTPQQQTGFQQTGQYAQSGQPYFGLAGNYIANAGQPIGQQQIGQYLNPYANYVMANLGETQGQQMADVTGKLTQQAGGVGADRIAVGQSELARQQNLASGQTLAGIYGSALQAAQQQQQAQLAAGYGLGNLGATAQTAGLQGAQANYGMGLQQQQLAQNQLNAQYANTLAQLAYPYQNTQFLAGITGGLAGALGGTTGGYQYTTPPPPNPYSQIAGLGIGAAGLAGAYNSFNTPGIQAGATGGRVGYAGGGNVDRDDSSDYSDNVLSNMAGGNGGNDAEAKMGDLSKDTQQSPIPGLSVNSPDMMKTINFGSGQQQQQQGIGIGDIAKTAAAILPLFALNTGGRIGYADGGMTNPFTPGTPGSPYGMAGGTPYGGGMVMPASYIPGLSMPSGGGGGNHPALNFGTPQTPKQDMSTKDLMSGLTTIAKLYKDNKQKEQDYKDDASEDAQNDGSSDLGAGSDSGTAFGGRIDEASPYQAFWKGGYQGGGGVDDPADFASRYDPIYRTPDDRAIIGKQLMREGASISPFDPTVRTLRDDIPRPPASPLTDDELLRASKFRSALKQANPYRDITDEGFNPRPDATADRLDIVPPPKQVATTSVPGSVTKAPEWQPKLPSVPQRIQAKLDRKQQGPTAPPLENILQDGGARVPIYTSERQAPPAPIRPPDVPEPLPYTPRNVSRLAQQQGVPYPDVNPARDPSRRLTMNPWLALASAGFGIAGGTSPYGITNVGQGAQQGIKTLFEQRKELASEEAINQRARQLSFEVERERLKQTGLTPAEQVRARQAQETLEQAKWTPFYDQEGNGWFVKPGEKAIPMGLPGQTTGPMGQPGLPVGVQAGAQPGVQTAAKPQQPFGVDYTEPDETSRPQRVINPKTGEISQIQAQLSREALQRVNKSGEAANSSWMQIQQLEQALEEIDKASKGGLLGTGAYATQRVELARKLNTLSSALGLGPITSPDALANAEEANKITVRLGQAQAALLGARESQQVIQQSIQANPGIENTPQGRKLILEAMKANIQRNKEIQQYVNDTFSRYRSAATAEAAFNRANPPEKYIARAARDAAAEEYRNPAVHAKAVANLRAHADDPVVVATFNKIYHNTAKYFLKDNRQ